MQRKIIFDTDPGVDDAMAFLLLVAEPDLDLQGVTSVFGNATIETTTQNALYLTQRFAPSVPVAAGAAGPLNGADVSVNPAIHGRNGLGDITLPNVTVEADTRPAHRFIIDTVRASPGEITLLAVGPFTNLALALRDDPSIVPLVKDVVVMGGAFGFNGHFGNVTPAAEANIAADPEAADLVFAADWPIVAIGLDVTMEILMSNRYLADVRDAGGEAAAFVWDVTRNYAAFYADVAGVDGVFAHDSLAAAFLVAPGLVETRSGAVRVVLDGIARGATIQKPDARTYGPGAWDARRSHLIASAVDPAAFLRFYADRLALLDKP